MSIKIALVGNPNCGKTTLFNALTGANQYVGNWPGVTVEKKEGKIKWNKDVTVMDLPGIYSLSPYSPEELVARNYLINEKPDVILNILDGTNLERNLYLTTQLAELEIPMVIAVNMIDVVRKSGGNIDVRKMALELGCEVIEISAVKGEGTKEIAEAAVRASENQIIARTVKYNQNVEASLDSSVFVVSFKGGMQRLYKYDVGKNHVYEVSPTAFTRVHVMECGCDIVNYDDCCKLYSPTGKLILSSNTSWGICDIGYDKVRFEGEVIIDVLSGRPIGEADAQISNMTRNGILHGRYFSKTVDGKRGFLCDSKLLPSICGSRFHDNLTVIYQQGTFYPTTFDVNDDIAGYQPNSYYYSRLRAMIPR